MKKSELSAPAAKNSALEAFKQGGAKGFLQKRFLASIIDFILVSLLCQLAFMLFGVPDWSRYLETQSAIQGLAAGDPLTLERMRLYQECFLWTLAIGAAYEALMLTAFRGTAGKLVFGLRVVAAKDGGLLMEKLRVLLRAALKALSLYLLSALPFVFMCLTALGNAEGRSGFDVFAGTKTVDVRRK